MCHPLRAMTPPPDSIVRVRVGDRAYYARPSGDELLLLDAAPWEGGRPSGVRARAGEWTLLAPATPTKIVCVGLNYREHVAESVTVVPGGGEVPKEPLIFLKPPSAVIANGEAIRYPGTVTRLDPEAELALVIGKRARAVSESDAMSHVAGFTCFNDVSARNHQRQDGQWTRAKGFDTFAPLGPWLATGRGPEGLRVECRVNGEVRQRGNTSDLIFPIPFLITYISRIMTLEPGDVIATGTPAGVAPVQPGDRIEIEVEGVGVLTNTVETAT